MTDLVLEKTWIVNGLEINKSYEVSCLTGKKDSRQCSICC